DLHRLRVLGLFLTRHGRGLDRDGVLPRLEAHLEVVIVPQLADALVVDEERRAGAEAEDDVAVDVEQALVGIRNAGHELALGPGRPPRPRGRTARWGVA